MTWREHFLSCLDIPFDATDNECWGWKVGLNSNGYGSFDSENASRVSWKMFRGLIPDGLFVLHKCDNRQCNNPNHLFLGTQSENMLDCSKKGRLGCESQKFLVQDDVNKIFRLRRQGATYRSIGILVKISKSRASAIFNGKTTYKEIV